MRSSRSNDRRMLQAESVQLWLKMEQCQEEEQFKPLLQRSEEISAILGHPKAEFSCLAEFRALRNNSPVESTKISSSTLSQERRNLESASWYLTRLSEKARESSLASKEQICSHALVAQDALNSLIGDIAPTADEFGNPFDVSKK